MRGYIKFYRVFLGIFHIIFLFFINYITFYFIRDIKTGIRILYNDINVVFTYLNITNISKSLKLGRKITLKDLKRLI